MPILQVSADILIRLVGAAPTEQTRYYLNGVHVRTRQRTPGVVLEATDGHMLAIEHDEHGAATAPGIVRTAAIADIARVAKIRAKQLRIGLDGLRVVVEPKTFRVFPLNSDAYDSPEHSFTDGEAFVDGTFPECERVIPKPSEDNAAPLFRGGLNPALLLQLARTAKTLDKKTAALPCVFFQNGEGDPALVRVKGAPNWLGVLMPMRADVAGPRPAWYECGALDASQVRPGKLPADA